MHSPSMCPYQERRSRPVLPSPPANAFDGPSTDAARLPKRPNFIKVRRPIPGGADGPTCGVVQNAEGCRRVRCLLFQHACPDREKDSRPAEIRGQQRPCGHAHGRIRPSSGCDPAFRRCRRDPGGVRKPKVRPPLPTCRNSPAAASTCSYSTTSKFDRLRRARARYSGARVFVNPEPGGATGKAVRIPATPRPNTAPGTPHRNGRLKRLPPELPPLYSRATPVQPPGGW
jgi:hypothetical protein